MSSDKLFAAKKFLEYQRKAKTKYYLHSPFVYDFYMQVLDKKDKTPKLAEIAALHQRLRESAEYVELRDFGTGKSGPRSVASIAQKAVVNRKYGELLFRLVSYFQPKRILELGTSLGISSAYMAAAHVHAQLLTLEGCEALAALARKHHALLNLPGVEVISGEFSQSLPAALAQMEQVDLVFFDGNHQQLPTLQYYDHCLPKAHADSVFIFDDIYWSREMAEAWHIAKQHPRVTLALDLYKYGLVFFHPDKLSKEEFVLRY